MNNQKQIGLGIGILILFIILGNIAIAQAAAPTEKKVVVTSNGFGGGITGGALSNTGEGIFTLQAFQQSPANAGKEEWDVSLKNGKSGKNYFVLQYDGPVKIKILSLPKDRVVDLTTELNHQVGKKEDSYDTTSPGGQDPVTNSLHFDTPEKVFRISTFEGKGENRKTVTCTVSKTEAFVYDCDFVVKGISTLEMKATQPWRMSYIYTDDKNDKIDPTEQVTIYFEAPSIPACTSLLQCLSYLNNAIANAFK